MHFFSRVYPQHHHPMSSLDSSDSEDEKNVPIRYSECSDCDCGEWYAEEKKRRYEEQCTAELVKKAHEEQVKKAHEEQMKKAHEEQEMKKAQEEQVKKAHEEQVKKAQEEQEMKKVPKNAKKDATKTTKRVTRASSKKNSGKHY